MSNFEIHTEDIQLNGLLIKFYVILSQPQNHYQVVCKAFDKNNSLLWRTELLDDTGKPLTFHALTTAVSKTRATLAVYKTKNEPA